jgi:hypothetical protein
MLHHCHAVDCKLEVPPEMHMCLKHWRMVPRLVQDLIWKHYRKGQEIDKQPSIEYVATAFISISCVALKEGKELPKLTAGAAG